MWILPVLTLESATEKAQWKKLQENVIFLMQQQVVDPLATTSRGALLDGGGEQAVHFYRILFKYDAMEELESVFLRQWSTEERPTGGSMKRGGGRSGRSPQGSASGMAAFGGSGEATAVAVAAANQARSPGRRRRFLSFLTFSGSAAPPASTPTPVAAVAVATHERDIFRHWEWIQVHLMTYITDVPAELLRANCELLVRELHALAREQTRLLSEEPSTLRGSSPDTMGESSESDGTDDEDSGSGLDAPRECELFERTVRSFQREPAHEAAQVLAQFRCSLIRGSARNGLLWLTPNALYFASYGRSTLLTVPLVAVMAMERKAVGAVQTMIVLNTTMGEFLFDHFMPADGPDRLRRAHILLKHLTRALAARVSRAFDAKVASDEHWSDLADRVGLRSSRPRSSSPHSAAATSQSYQQLRSSDAGAPVPPLSASSPNPALPSLAHSTWSSDEESFSGWVSADDIFQARKQLRAQARFRLPADEYVLAKSCPGTLKEGTLAQGPPLRDLACKLAWTPSSLLLWLPTCETSAVLRLEFVHWHHPEPFRRVQDSPRPLCTLHFDWPAPGLPWTLLVEQSEDLLFRLINHWLKFKNVTTTPQREKKREEEEEEEESSSTLLTSSSSIWTIPRVSAPGMFDLLTDEHQFPDDYLQRTADRFEPWNEYIRRMGPHLILQWPVLRSLSRDVMPDQFRGSYWMHVSGAANALASKPHLYGELVARAGEVDEETALQIDKDVPRTLPDHPYYVSDEGQAALRRVLRAYALYNADVQYCQGMNFIAAVFLCFLGEAETFWLLDTLLLNVLPEYHGGNMAGAVVDQWVFVDLLRRHLPAEAAAVEQLSRMYLPAGQNLISCISFSWFLTLFAGWLPMEAALAVMTVALTEGRRTVVQFQTALAILHLKSEALASCETIPTAKFLSADLRWADLAAAIHLHFRGVTHKEVQALRRRQSYHLLVQQIQQVHLSASDYECTKSLPSNDFALKYFSLKLSPSPSSKIRSSSSSSSDTSSSPDTSSLSSSDLDLDLDSISEHEKQDSQNTTTPENLLKEPHGISKNQMGTLKNQMGTTLKNQMGTTLKNQMGTSSTSSENSLSTSSEHETASISQLIGKTDDDPHERESRGWMLRSTSLRGGMNSPTAPQPASPRPAARASMAADGWSQSMNDLSTYRASSGGDLTSARRTRREFEDDESARRGSVPFVRVDRPPPSSPGEHTPPLARSVSKTALALRRSERSSSGMGGRANATGVLDLLADSLAMPSRAEPKDHGRLFMLNAFVVHSTEDLSASAASDAPSLPENPSLRAHSRASRFAASMAAAQTSSHNSSHVEDEAARSARGSARRLSGGPLDLPRILEAPRLSAASAARLPLPAELERSRNQHRASLSSRRRSVVPQQQEASSLRKGRQSHASLGLPVEDIRVEQLDEAVSPRDGSPQPLVHVNPPMD